MARIAISDHLGRRDLLAICWNHIPDLIALLAPAAQWELHRFYAPSHDLSDDEFVAHMKQVLLLEPSLAQRVGKHYKLIFLTFKAHADVVGKENWEEIRRRVVREHAATNADPTERRPLVIKPLVRPELDTLRLARTYLELARRQRGDTAA